MEVNYTHENTGNKIKHTRSVKEWKQTQTLPHTHTYRHTPPTPISKIKRIQKSTIIDHCYLSLSMVYIHNKVIQTKRTDAKKFKKSLFLAHPRNTPQNQEWILPQGKELEIDIPTNCI